jgi:hypothetical protein
VTADRLPSPQPRDFDFLRIEVATVQDPDGHWQAFVSRVNLDGVAIPIPDPQDPFALVTLPTRALAEDFAAVLVWNYLDALKVRAVRKGRKIWREVNALE